MKADEHYDPDSIFRDPDESFTFDDRDETSEEMDVDPKDFMHSTDDDDDSF